MAKIRIVNLLKKFGELRAVDDLNYTFEDGKVTCLLGPSGCGKTTLLRLIAGLTPITSGKIYFDDQEITGLSTRQRNMGMVFQYPVTYRGLTTEQNIALPLKKQNLPEKEITERVNESCALLDLDAIRKKEAWALPGVLRQKIAVAREVARRPDIILFDEPLTNVDAHSKTQFKRSFKELTQKLKQTIIYVTHDQTEAMTFGDYIALMNNGKIVQYDSPRELYNHPREVFGGWFLGNPGMFFFTPDLVDVKGKRMISLPFTSPLIEVDCPDHELENMRIGIRPEHVIASPNQVFEAEAYAELVSKWIVTGGQYLLTAQIGDVAFRVKVLPQTGIDINGGFYCGVHPEHVMVYDKAGIKMETKVSA